MRLLRAATCLYAAGQLDATIMLEEAHTAVETMLRDYAGKGGGAGTFAQLVGAASTGGIIDRDLHDQLIELKDLRRGVKHQGRGIDADRVTPLVYAALQTCQRIAAIIRHE